MSTDPVREELAAYAHKAWSGWMKYLFVKSTPLPGGEVALNKDLVARWTRQMNTEYQDLPENEKELDRVEADEILGIMDRGK